ncbi:MULTISPECIES: FAD:protein FMN transferase [unclassified Marinobacter]|jgi:thiamine biosynthesis lipoprotein|uniref:FAD:protein FMN transferase n=1 Tax=unclassified Marinobacter TaxID=83889 RepID=UPI000C8BAB2C|nr:MULTISPECIES: FAD:protein FMN transferase [unclassified Marinobacter]MAB52253.1 thiamine biosynthesis protein ApbE [Marinobacter sp.]MDC8455841.1 FAD:protein FMN transferase [Marinobacter sp. DS40M6]|tara:strand:- start:1041 stop:2000 length:960 start_codon:yes stop_codon:yes gene_type:complete
MATLLTVAMPAQAEWVRVSGTAMTTAIEMEFWTEDPAVASEAGDAVLALFDRIDRQMSRYREDSELSRVNREAANGPVEVSDSLFTVLQQALRISELSHGAFDISFGSIGYLYDFRARQQPSDEELAEGLAKVNYRSVVLDPSANTVRFLDEGVRLDLGGIAKGYTVDRGIDILKSFGIRHARLSAGGDLRLLGDKRGKPWIVGIRDPRSESRNAMVLPLTNVAVSTSGDYERFFFDDNNERVHHILSPATGKPAKGVQSVTILGDDSITTDGLSTAVFVLGAAKGLEMVNRLKGIDAVIIDEQRQVHYSDGLMPPERE